MSKDEFYVGYAKKAPKKLARFVVLVVLLSSIFLLAYSVTNHFFRVPFHYGATSQKYVTLEGVFSAKPHPMLLSQRLGKTAQKVDSVIRVSRYYVVPPGKRGLGKLANKWDNKYVSMGGKLVYRDNQTMFVINKKSIKELKKQKILKQILKVSINKNLGEFTLKGEIVDSKCYLGQMQPGSGKTHRACATLCIRGGLPPLFISRLPELGLSRLYLVLVSPEGEPVNQKILDIVAEPVEIKGNIIQKDNLYFLEADPKTYKRLSTL